MISIDDKLIIGLECCLNKDNTIDCAACPFNGKSDETGKTCKQIVWEALKQAAETASSLD